MVTQHNEWIFTKNRDAICSLSLYLSFVYFPASMRRKRGIVVEIWENRNTKWNWNSNNEIQRFIRCSVVGKWSVHDALMMIFQRMTKYWWHLEAVCVCVCVLYVWVGGRAGVRGINISIYLPIYCAMRIRAHIVARICFGMRCIVYVMRAKFAPANIDYKRTW